ncbi:hypothetical protein ONZ45_g1656 [Pleurotus djamor]|nr:hypothetical protein ONZ45_g1656 [Pleurotus djamor]
MLRLASPEATSQPHFTEAVALYAVAGLLELASEPMYCLAITTLRTSARVRAEGLGVTVKSIVTFVVLYLSANYPQYLRLAVGLFGGKPAEVASDGEFALLAFALGQLAYGATILAAFVSAFWSQRETVKFREISAPGKPHYWFNKGTLTLALTINAQSILKHVLTEGDKLVLSYFSPLDGQGGYAIAANYGSLVARLLFQPIEETLRLFFARTLSTQGLSSLVRAHTSLVHLINTQLSLSLILVTFAPLYLPYVLPILLPPAFLRTTNAAELLGVWIWYLPVLSVNGALEAFVAVTSGKWDLARQSFFMLIFSVVYLASSYVLYVHLGFGDAAFIYANIISLLARIGYALSFIRAYFRARFDALNDESKSTSKPYPFAPNPTQLLPHPFLIAFCGLSRVVLTTPFVRPPPPPKAYSTRLGPIKQLFEAQVAAYIAVGLLCAVTSLGVWWTTSGRKIRQSQYVAEKKED